MGLFTDQVDALNDICIDVFGTANDSAITYTQGITSFTLLSIPIDPQRLEGLAPGIFTVHWVRFSDFAPHSITPRAGDRVDIGALHFIVDQIQADEGGGVRLIMSQRAS
jgi:hypothetical protein